MPLLSKLSKYIIKYTFLFPLVQKLFYNNRSGNASGVVVEYKLAPFLLACSIYLIATSAKLGCGIIIFVYALIQFCCTDSLLVVDHLD